MGQDARLQRRIHLLPQGRAVLGIQQFQQRGQFGRVNPQQMLANALVLAIFERLNDLLAVGSRAHLFSAVWVGGVRIHVGVIFPYRRGQGGPDLRVSELGDGP